MIRGATIIWKHDRRQTTYSIIGFAVDEDGFPTVVYKPTEEPDKLYTRRCSEFFDGRFRQIEVDDFEEELEDVHAMAEAVESTRKPYQRLSDAQAEAAIVARRDTRVTLARSGE